jgi:PrgI family protein
MGQYKMPQNVEAEDKILGPLTFKQFIYACIGVGWAIVCFAIFRTLPAVMIILGFPPTMLFLLLAFYTRDGQNFEQLLLALLGFFASPRRRIWVKEAVVETFHIEPASIKAETTQRNATEVRSELEKLATLIDSRGWNQPPAPESHLILPTTAHEDRLITPPPPTSEPSEPQADMLDLQGSPLAQDLAKLLDEAAGAARQAAVSQMTATVPPAPTQPTPSVSTVTPPPPNGILKLATLGDVSVSQVAAQATRLNPPAPPQSQKVDPNSNGS